MIQIRRDMPQVLLNHFQTPLFTTSLALSFSLGVPILSLQTNPKESVFAHTPNAVVIELLDHVLQFLLF